MLKMPLANPKLDNSHPFRSANQISAPPTMPLNGLEAGVVLIERQFFVPLSQHRVRMEWKWMRQWPVSQRWSAQNRWKRRRKRTGNWKTISQDAKSLLSQMLHIAPNRRPKADQILRHPWLWQYTQADFMAMQQNHLQQQQQQQQQLMQQQQIFQTHPTQYVTQQKTLLPENTAVIKGAVNATFRAISSPQAANLGPVRMSELATRRLLKKKSTADSS
uniref:CSON004964 protein n=1 Tax=Culicoides sonorensis TaxID=179676 RepID=A0A336LXE1_CULSO